MIHRQFVTENDRLASATGSSACLLTQFTDNRRSHCGKDPFGGPSHHLPRVLSEGLSRQTARVPGSLPRLTPHMQFTRMQVSSGHCSWKPTALSVPKIQPVLFTHCSLQALRTRPPDVRLLPLAPVHRHHLIRLCTLKHPCDTTYCIRHPALVSSYKETTLGVCDSTSHPFVHTFIQGNSQEQWESQGSAGGDRGGGPKATCATCGRWLGDPQQQSCKLSRDPQVPSHGLQEASTVILQDSPGGTQSHPFFFFTPGGDLLTSRGDMVTGQGRVACTTAVFVAPAR